MLREEAITFVKRKLFVGEKFCDRKVRTLTDEERAYLLDLIPVPSISEAAYWLVYDISDYPIKCKNCSGPSKFFTSFNQGYTRQYCSLQCSNGSKSVQDKKKKSSREIYGTDFPWQSAAIKQKIASKQKLRNFSAAPVIADEIAQQGFTLISWDPSKLSNPATLSCPQNHTFNRQVEGWHRWFISCPSCSKTRSTGEVALEAYVKDLGFDVAETGKRKILPSGLELDIYVPSKKIAIEFNGVFYHSTGIVHDKVAKKRHVIKQDEAEGLGITLLQVWETEWNQKRDIVRSRIASALGVSERVGARSCVIKSVDGSTAAHFLDDNHIQGKCISSINQGLYFEGELVALMTFSKPRFSKKAQWELLRYCTKRGLSVVGGPSRLLTSFIKQQKPSSIISYADRRWSQGNLYRTLGFKQLPSSAPGYWYVSNAGLHHRMQFQKHRLSKQLQVFDANLTEEENMLLNGYRVLWDCGNHVFIWQP
jgi:hypothetical protein